MTLCAELGGFIGLDFRSFSLRQLVQMAKGSQFRAQYQLEITAHAISAAFGKGGKNVSRTNENVGSVINSFSERATSGGMLDALKNMHSRKE